MSVEHTIRTKDGGSIKVALTRSSAIKAQCTECCGFGEAHPKECSDKLCPLWPFRGKITLAYKPGDAIAVDPEETSDDKDE